MNYRSPRSPFIGSGVQQQGGFLGTHKQDFNSHVSGTGYNHHASDIVMSPTLANPFNGANVQSVLTAMASNISLADGTYVSIGLDGYSKGDYNVTSTVTLADCLNNALSESRLRNGGTIFIRCGSYVLDETINLPNGITILGENGGTYIDRQTAGTSAFKILTISNSKKITFGANSTQTETSPVKTKIKDIVFTSNLIKNDSYILSEPYISVEHGSQFEIDNCVMLGQVRTITGGETFQMADTAAISTIFNYSSSVNPTNITVDKCYIDGFNSGIRNTSSLFNKDYTIVTNSRIRCYGRDSGFGANCINTNICNVTICNNRFIAAIDKGTNRVALETVILINNVSGEFSTIDMYAPRFNITDNTGINEDSDSSEVKFVTQQSTYYIGNIANNFFGRVEQNTIKVGTGNSGSLGDVNGIYALDVLSQIGYLQTTDVELLPGAYVFTKNYLPVNIIGQANNSIIPTIAFTHNSSNVTLNAKIKNVKLSNGYFSNSKYFNINVTERYIETKADIVIDSCILDNVIINTKLEEETIDTTLYRTCSITNNIFEHTSDYDGYRMLNVYDHFNSVTIDNNYFAGYGYSIFAGKSNGTSVNLLNKTYYITNNNFNVSTFINQKYDEDQDCRHIRVNASGYNVYLTNNKFNHSSFSTTGTYLPISCKNIIQVIAGSATVKDNDFILYSNDGSRELKSGESYYLHLFPNSINIKSNFIEFTNNYCIGSILINNTSDTSASVINIVGNSTYNYGDQNCLNVKCGNISTAKTNNIRIFNNYFVGSMGSNPFSSNTANYYPYFCDEKKYNQVVFIEANGWNVDFSRNLITHQQITPSYTIGSTEGTGYYFRDVAALLVVNTKLSADTAYQTVRALTTIRNNEISVMSSVLNYASPYIRTDSTCIALYGSNICVCENNLNWEMGTWYTSAKCIAGYYLDLSLGYAFGWLKITHGTDYGSKTNNTVIITGNTFDTNAVTTYNGQSVNSPNNPWVNANQITLFTNSNSWNSKGIFKDNIFTPYQLWNNIKINTIPGNWEIEMTDPASLNKEKFYLV